MLEYHLNFILAFVIILLLFKLLEKEQFSINFIENIIIQNNCDCADNQ